MVCLAPRTPPALVNQQTDWFMLVAYREPGITRITFSSSSQASNPSWMHGNHQENAERKRERKRGGREHTKRTYRRLNIYRGLWRVSLFIYLFVSLFSTRRENFLTYKMTSRRGRESSQSQIDVTLLW